MKTFAIATLGCKVNQYESESLKRLLGQLAPVDFGAPADLYIINTCGVTGEAEAKARQLIRRARRAAPEAMLVLTGCFRPADAANFKGLGVDLLVDNAGKARLAELLPLGPTLPPGIETRPHGTKNVAGRTRIFIKVQDGCDEECSYCAIPTFRSAMASRPVEDILGEISRHAAAGTREAVLTGIHLGKYGVDLNGRAGLARLVQRILSETDIARIRLSSIEPQEIGAELIAMLASEPRLARHLHVPLQSGSDRILTAMNRRYTAGDFLRLVDRIRRRVPDIGLTTDVMVGFPGERDEDFEATVKLVKAADFSRLHIFKFSPRPGTAAAGLPGRVDPRRSSHRASRLKALGKELAADFARGFVGRPVWAVVETEKNGFQTGLTGEYVRVKWEQAVGPAGGLVESIPYQARGEVLMVRSP